MKSSNKETHPLAELLELAGLSLLMMVVAGLATRSLMSGDSLSGVRWAQLLTSLLVFAAPVAVIVCLHHADWRDYCGFRFARRHWVAALAGAVVVALLLPLVDWLTVWNDGWHFSGAMGGLESQLRAVQAESERLVMRIVCVPSAGAMLANLVVVALAAAVCEELFFRVAVQGALLRWVKNPHVAVWLAAALFSLAHGELFAFVPRLVLGGLLGYLFYYGQSLLVNVTAHFFNNALVVLAYWLSARDVIAFDPSEPIMTPWLLTLCCTLAAVGLMWVAVVAKKGDNKLKTND